MCMSGHSKKLIKMVTSLQPSVYAFTTENKEIFIFFVTVVVAPTSEG